MNSLPLFRVPTSGGPQARVRLVGMWVHERGSMSTVAWPTGRALGCAVPAGPCVPEVSSYPAPSAVVDPEAFPYTDAFVVDSIISGKYGFRTVLLDRGLSPVDAVDAETQTPYTGRYFDGCESISVCGLSENTTEEDLLSMCRKFGTVIRVDLIKPQAQGDLGCATVFFEEPSAAQRARSFLHLTRLHGKEIRVGWGLYADELETSSHYWLYVWVSKGTTAQQLFRGFRRCGAPCTDARVVREPSDEEPEGVGAVAFRTVQESTAIRRALPLSNKTDWTKHPGWHWQKC